jgi:flagellar biogenesis protein FliO
MRTDVIQQLLAVCLVMVLLLVSLGWLRRKGMAHLPAGLRLRRSPRRLKLVEKLPLTAQHSLHLVHVDGRALLIGVSPGGCTLLENARVEPAAGESA